MNVFVVTSLKVVVEVVGSPVTVAVLESEVSTVEISTSGTTVVEVTSLETVDAIKVDVKISEDIS